MSYGAWAGTVREYVPVNVLAGIDPTDRLAALHSPIVGNPRTWRTFTRENLARMPAVRRVRASACTGMKSIGRQARAGQGRAGQGRAGQAGQGRARQARHDILQKDY